MRSSTTSRMGFTLIELLVVISIISLLMTNPPTHRVEPKGAPTDALMATALPSLSMIDKWDVPIVSIVVSDPHIDVAAS